MVRDAEVDIVAAGDEAVVYSGVEVVQGVTQGYSLMVVAGGAELGDKIEPAEGDSWSRECYMIGCWAGVGRGSTDALRSNTYQGTKGE